MIEIPFGDPPVSSLYEPIETAEECAERDQPGRTAMLPLWCARQIIYEEETFAMLVRNVEHEGRRHRQQHFNEARRGARPSNIERAALHLRIGRGLVL